MELIYKKNAKIRRRGPIRRRGAAVAVLFTLGQIGIGRWLGRTTEEEVPYDQFSFASWLRRLGRASGASWTGLTKDGVVGENRSLGLRLEWLSAVLLCTRQVFAAPTFDSGGPPSPDVLRAELHAVDEQIAKCQSDWKKDVAGRLESAVSRACSIPDAEEVAELLDSAHKLVTFPSWPFRTPALAYDNVMRATKALAESDASDCPESAGLAAGLQYLLEHRLIAPGEERYLVPRPECLAYLLWLYGHLHSFTEVLGIVYEPEKYRPNTTASVAQLTPPQGNVSSAAAERWWSARQRDGRLAQRRRDRVHEFRQDLLEPVRAADERGELSAELLCVLVPRVANLLRVPRSRTGTT